MNPLKVIIAGFLVWILIRTINYGRWTWNKKNKLGGVMIMLLAFVSAFFTAYVFIIKDSWY